MNEDMDVNEQIKMLKQRFRTLMNGVTSNLMREKGVVYKINFGVELLRLRELADELGPDHDLAQALWKEDIRECRILAGMLQPVDTFLPEMADIWVERIRYLEEAEYVVMNLFCRLPYASQKAFQWVADEREWFQVCGFLILSRLFMMGKTCNPRAEDEFLDQVAAAVSSASMSVRQAAQRALVKFMDLGEQEEKRGLLIVEGMQKRTVGTNIPG